MQGTLFIVFKILFYLYSFSIYLLVTEHIRLKCNYLCKINLKCSLWNNIRYAVFHKYNYNLPT